MNDPERVAAKNSSNQLANPDISEMKAFESTGFWSLPGDENRVAGTLHVSKDGDLRLPLFGSLGGERQGFATKAHKIIRV